MMYGAECKRHERKHKIWKETEMEMKQNKKYQHKDKGVMENRRKDEGKKAYGDEKSVVSSKMSVEDRHMRALKLTQDKTYC